jgi:lipopolysaccharide/colanic/teichoic acid biosynthesis glycosyltransferase
VGKYTDIPSPKSNHPKLYLYKKLFTSFILMLGILSLVSLTFHIEDVSRYTIVGSLLLGLILEALPLSRLPKKYRGKDSVIRLNISPIPLLTELITLCYTILLIFIFGLKLRSITELEILISSGIFISWLVSSILSHQFEFNLKESYWKLIWKYIRAYVILGALVTFQLFLLRIEMGIGVFLLIGIGIFSLMSWLTLTFIYVSRSPARVDEVKLKLIKATDWIEEKIVGSKSVQNGSYAIEGNEYNHYLAEQLSGIYLKRFPEIYKFIEEKLDLLTFDFRACSMIRSADTYNIEVLPDDALELYLNLHQLNDIRRINNYLIEVNDKLKEGGVFIGCLHPNFLRFRKFLNQYPTYLARLFYFIDFIWKRLIPKLPVLKKFYFALTRGRNRALSLAEGLGRLHYCGFEILGLKTYGRHIYFISKKVSPPVGDLNPSYGPLIKLKRTGKGGKLLKVYKLRTMHPYSEYLQQFVYDMNELEEGGKLKDDFRITGWGKFMRKLWLDEFPMFINWFRGELKLVGVRPLSKQYLGLYRKDLIKRRQKQKPGLVPPFYVDLPKTLEEIMASEEKYLDEYEKHPLITDVKYFFKAWYNILVKRARSA